MQRGRATSLMPAIAVFCAWFACPAAGQDARWFREHANNEKPPYYEGLLDQPNAKQAYEVLGFFAYGGAERPRLAAHPAETSKLKVWFYVPKEGEGNATPDSITIRAKQIASRTNYLVQSMPVSARKDDWTPFSWKTSPFISRYQINPNNLAVLAQSKTNDSAEGDILPVVFSLDCQDEQISHYELMLKIQRYSLADLAYQLRPAGNTAGAAKTCYFTFSDSDTCGPARPKRSTPIEVGTVIQLHIPVTAPAGWQSLHIFGAYKDSSEGLDLTYRFFHQPNFICTQ
jgi:hypothetical protein